MAGAVLIAAILAPYLVGVLGGPLLQEFGLDGQEFGAVIGVFFASAAITGPLGGSIADRFGWHKGCVVGICFSTVGLGGVGFFASGLASLVLCMVLGGIGLGIAGPASNVIVVAEIHSSYNGRAFGFKQSVPAIAVGLAGIALPTIALTLGWRWPFRMAALIGVALVVAVSLMDSARDSVVAKTSVSRRSTISGSEAVMLVGIAVGVALGTMSAGALTAFSTATLTDAGVGVGFAGLIVTAGSILAIAVRIGSGWVADRGSLNGVWGTAVLLAVGAVGYGVAVAGTPSTVTLGFALAFGGGWGWNALILAGVVNTYRDSPGAASGVVQFGASSGAALGPAIFGVLSDHVGLEVAWLVPMAWAAFGALIMFAVSSRWARLSPLS